jgi:hypothetical protein
MSVSDSDPLDDEFEIDLASLLGAGQDVSHQVLTLYIPDRDRENNEIGTQRKWVLEAADLLARMGGGVTIMPPTEGGWLDEQHGRIIWEHPVIVYTYIKPDQFVQTLPRLREFLHRMGRETNQGEIAVEFDGQFYRITRYDAS